MVVYPPKNDQMLTTLPPIFIKVVDPPPFFMKVVDPPPIFYESGWSSPHFSWIWFTLPPFFMKVVDTPPCLSPPPPRGVFGTFPKTGISSNCFERKSRLLHNKMMHIDTKMATKERVLVQEKCPNILIYNTLYHIDHDANFNREKKSSYEASWYEVNGKV